MKVNEFDLPRATGHVSLATELWRARSLRTWTLNLGILTGSGVTIIQPG